MTRRRSFSGVPWEPELGYCRAVRVGDHVYVKGTVPVEEDGSTHASGDPYAQAKRCFELISDALSDVGATMADVVRTRMFVTDIGLWREFGRAHQEAFSQHPPVATMVGVEALIDPEMLIEIEVDAICEDSDSHSRPGSPEPPPR